MRLTVTEQCPAIRSTRDSVLKDLRRLEKSPPEAFLNEAVACHLRKDGGGGQAACRLCRAHDVIEGYEGLIFHFVKSELKEMKVRSFYLWLNGQGGYSTGETLPGCLN